MSVAGAVSHDLFKSLIKDPKRPFLIQEKYMLIHINDNKITYLSLFECDGDTLVHDKTISWHQKDISSLAMSINTVHNLECPYCFEYTAYIDPYEADFPGSIECSNCNTQFMDLDYDSENCVQLMFDEARFIKLFPRWRWKS